MFGNYGSCKGDSGGPLIRYIYKDGLNKAYHLQIGLVSGGVGACGSADFPSVYVRLENEEVLGFIKQETGAEAYYTKILGCFIKTLTFAGTFLLLK